MCSMLSPEWYEEDASSKHAGKAIFEFTGRLYAPRKLMCL